MGVNFIITMRYIVVINHFAPRNHFYEFHLFRTTCSTFWDSQKCPKTAQESRQRHFALWWRSTMSSSAFGRVVTAAAMDGSTEKWRATENRPIDNVLITERWKHLSLSSFHLSNDKPTNSCNTTCCCWCSFSFYPQIASAHSTHSLSFRCSTPYLFWF